MRNFVPTLHPSKGIPRECVNASTHPMNGRAGRWTPEGVQSGLEAAFRVPPRAVWVVRGGLRMGDLSEQRTAATLLRT